MTDGIHRRRISCQVKGVRIEQLLGDGDLVGLGQANVRVSSNNTVHRQGADVVQECTHAAHAIEVVIYGFDRCVGRYAVEELQLANRRFDRSGRGYRLKHCYAYLSLCCHRAR